MGCGCTSTLPRAIPYLKRLVYEDFPLRWKRFAVRRLAGLYHRLGQKPKALRYYELLTRLVSSVQRGYGQLERLRYLVHSGEPRRALWELERLMDAVPEGRLRARFQLLKGVALGLTGQTDASIKRLQQVEQPYGNRGVARQARVYRKKWQKR